MPMLMNRSLCFMWEDLVVPIVSVGSRCCNGPGKMNTTYSVQR